MPRHDIQERLEAESPCDYRVRRDIICVLLNVHVFRPVALSQQMGTL